MNIACLLAVILLLLPQPLHPADMSLLKSLPEGIPSPPAALPNPATGLLSADLSLEMTDEPDPQWAGEPITYTLHVLNNGPQATPGVILTDTLPAGMTFVSALPSQGTCQEETGEVGCVLDTINVAQVVTVTLVAIPLLDGILYNHALVLGDENDLNPENNEVTVDTTVYPVADLAVSSLAHPEPVAPGSLITYTLFLTNTGPSASSGSSLTDTLSSQVNVVNVDPSWGLCQVDNSHAAPVVNCYPDSLSPQQVFTVTIVGSLPGWANGDLVNTASVGGDTFDPALENNTFTRVTPIRYIADLQVTKSASAGQVTIGSQLTYTLEVINNGPNLAGQVELVDDLPANLAFLSVTTSLGTCQHSSGVVTCSLGDLETSLPVGITIRVLAQHAGLVVNTAEISGSTYDPETANNTGSVLVDLLPLHRIYLPVIAKPPT